MLAKGRIDGRPLLAIQIAADYLLFEHLPVNLYELPAWVADELREVMRIYHANRPKE